MWFLILLLPFVFHVIHAQSPGVGIVTPATAPPIGTPTRTATANPYPLVLYNDVISYGQFMSFHVMSCDVSVSVSVSAHVTWNVVFGV